MLHKLSKQEIDNIFVDIAKELKKRLKGRNFSYELIVVGGTSILLNYSFRTTTMDIDCIDVNDALMNEIVNNVGNKYSLPVGWINTDFLKTASFSLKLIQYSSFYKSYLNNTLTVRTIKDEYLIAMKMVSARTYKNDYSDIYGIINENKNISKEKIIKAIKELYGDTFEINKDMLAFVNNIFNGNSINYEQIQAKETKEKEVFIKQISKNKNA